MFGQIMDSIEKKLKQSVVGIAGLGGLGSVVAVELVRAGIGTLIIADFDVVEKVNLNRQHYFLDQLGKTKVEATVENILRIDPEIEINTCDQKINAGNVLEIFAGSDVIAECFDATEEKQMIVETVLGRTDTPIVAVSGLAGYGNSNAIETKRISGQLVLIGDNESGIDSIELLTAARVWTAASHQANAILELLIDEL